MVYSFIRIAGLLPVTAFLSTYEIDKEIAETDNIFDAIEYCETNGGQLPIFTSTTEALGFVGYRKLISDQFSVKENSRLEIFKTYNIEITKKVSTVRNVNSETAERRVFLFS